MPTYNFTKERYDLIMNFIKTHVTATIPDFHFFKTPTYFPGPEKFAKYVGDTYDEDYLVKYAMMSFANFTDQKGKGWDYCPSTKPALYMQVFHEFLEAREDEDQNELPNSHDILVEALIDLRNEFITHREVVGNEQVLLDPIKQMGDLVIVGKCPFIADDDCLGDWINFRFDVEIQ